MPKIIQFGTEFEYAQIISYLIQQLSGCRCVQYITYGCWDLRIPEFRFNVVYHISLCGTSYSVLGWRGLNTRQACQLFRSVRDMRRRRLAQLPIHDLDITMKTDKSFLPPPAQSLRGCLNSRPGSHHQFKTNVFYWGSIFQPFYSVS